jgi:N-acyl-D-amino-acid deacylase
MHDLVITGGTLIDGSGAPARPADVAVEGDRIVGVGDDLGPGRRCIDADGKLVAPGWVDLHTHYDAQATWDPQLTPSGWHGVTTVVMGNCGVGFAPAHADARDELIAMMEGVEDIPGAALHEGITWEWETFPEYLDALDRRAWVADVGTQIPHGSLRAYVMGGRATEPATDDDVSQMTKLVGEGLAAGALGFSTSRTPLHRSKDGELVPGTTADHEELFAIGDAVRDAGHGVIQLALHHPEVLEQIPWLRELASRSGRRVTLNLQQIQEDPDLWRRVATELDRAATDGIPLWAQVAGRPIGILFSWAGSIHPFHFRSAFAPLAGLEGDELHARLADPALVAGLVHEAESAGLSPFLQALATDYDRMWPFSGETDYEPAPDASIAAIAAREGRRPTEVLFEQLQRDGGTGLIYFPVFNYADRSLEFIRELQQHPRIQIGLADSGAHVAAICDGATPTFMLSFWGRDRTRGETLPLEHLVHRQTRRTAEHYGLVDRGLVAPGMRADLNVIDFDALAIDPPRMVHDLPAGARRYVQRGRGYAATLCAGESVVIDGEPTGATPGRLVRGPQR